MLTRPDTASSTAEDLVVNYSVSGTAVAGAQYAELSGTVTIPAGETSAAIEVKPVLDILVKEDVAVVIDLVPDGFYLPQTSYAVTVVNDPDAVRDPLIRYVSESGSDTGNDGQTEATAFRTVSRAVQDIAADGGRVFVAPGRYEETALLMTGDQGEETSAIVLDHGISVIGATGDPSDVVINCAIFGNTSTSDATRHAHVWDGEKGCFVNCVGEVASNEFCFAGPSGFVDAASGDYRLTVASPALDRGASYAAIPRGASSARRSAWTSTSCSIRASCT